MQHLTDVLGNDFTRDVLQVTKDSEPQSPLPQTKLRALKNVSQFSQYNNDLKKYSKQS